MTDPIRDFVIMLAEDKNKVRIGIVDRREGEPEKVLAFHDLDAPGLTNMMVHLANYRAQMTDVVPAQFEPGLIHIKTEVNPAAYVANEGPMSKRFALALRHPGYGWLAFAWNEANGRNVTAMMMGEIMRMSTLPSGLISPSGRKL